jgi:hypothetical protein
LLLGTAACGGGSSLDPNASSSSATETSSSASETTTSSSSSSSTSTSTTASTTASTSGGGPLSTDSAGRELTLNDFFMPSTDWQEKRYDIADQSDVQGIGTTIPYCGSSYAQELELRLANNFDQLTFKVAQANDSRASDQSLSLEVLANNAQVEIRSVPFNQVQEFTIPVTGVNALKINLTLDEDVANCGDTGSVIGVLTDVTLS